MCRLIPVCLLLLLGACDEDREEKNAPPADGGTTNPCGKGLKPYQSACVPALDVCKDGEVPLPGGGCKAVGVVECTGGLKLPGAASCTLVGQPATCPSGWSKVKGGWCEPAYAKTKCAAGYKPVLGKTTCQQIRDCGSGTWGDIKTTTKTIYVDGSNKGTAIGTKAQPYATIYMAVKYARDGDHIAIAAGTYHEDVNLNYGVTLEGRCPQMVTIKQKSSNYYGAIDIFAKGVIIKGLTVTSDMYGIVIYKGSTAVIEEVVATGCGTIGIFVSDGAVGSIKNSLLHENHEAGLMMYKGKVDFTNTAILNNLPKKSTGEDGLGIVTTCTSTTDPAQQVTITDSLILGNTEFGIFLNTTRATLTRTVVADTKVRADKDYGIGIMAQVGQGATVGSKLQFTDVLVANNRDIGVYLQGSHAIADRLVIRDTDGSAKDNYSGQGIFLEPDHVVTKPSSLVLRDSVISGNRRAGISVISSDCEVLRSLILDTRIQLSTSDGGFGIATNMGETPRLDRQVTLTVKDSILARNSSTALNLCATKATLERVLVKDTKGGMTTNAGGQVQTGEGLLAYSDKQFTSKAETTITDSVFNKNRVNGVRIIGSKATITRTVIQDTQSGHKYKDIGYGLQMVRDIQDTPAEVDLIQSVLQGNHTVGAVVVGSKLTMKGSVIRNTLSDTSDTADGDGIVLMCPLNTSKSSSLTMEDSRLDNNRSVGLVVNNSEAVVDRSIIWSTQKQEADGLYGDGAQVFDKKGKLTMTRSWVDKSARSGILFSGGTGSVTNSVFSAGNFSIAMDNGATANIQESNLYHNNKRNPVAVDVGFDTAPLPKIPKY